MSEAPAVTKNSRNERSPNGRTTIERALDSHLDWLNKIEQPQITWRGTIAGLLIGTVVLITNFQFGLQTGWVSMMSLPSALFGFTIFKASPFSKNFTDVENVYIQSLAVSIGTGPLTFGLIGIMPALEKILTSDETGIGRPLNFTVLQLIIWCSGLSLFGIFFAVPLRKQVVVKEKLPFPSGRATATLISVLHRSELRSEEVISQVSALKSVNAENVVGTDFFMSEGPNDNKSEIAETNEEYQSRLMNLLLTFIFSSLYTLVSYFLPILRSIPIFGKWASQNYSWELQPSPAYIGQGIIMGLPTVSYMLFGSVLGWAILAPLAKFKGWASDDSEDFFKGPQGWIVWISLSAMIMDSVISFAAFALRSSYSLLQKFNTETDEPEGAPLLGSQVNYNYLSDSKINSLEKLEDQHSLKTSDAVKGIVLSSLVCIISMKFIFGEIFPIYAAVTAIVLAFFFSILAVRSLGETDLNPVSGIGKLSQLIFAFIIPSSNPYKLLINIVAGSITEAGAQQAGDLMQDLMTGHLIGASPKAQLVAQVIGTLYSIFLSTLMYKVYNTVYEIPSKIFRIPTAIVWVDCAKLVTGDGLPPMAFEFSVVFGVVFGVISLLKNCIPKNSRYYKYLIYLPSGVSVGIGIYNTPNFTLARFLGGFISEIWKIKSSEVSPSKRRISMVVFSSGLVLGEGLFSVLIILLTSLGVRHF